jgi:hypothetical protein
MLPRRFAWWLAGLLVVAIPLVAAAQFSGFFPFGARSGIRTTVAYDGRFTFVRVPYQRYGGWAADYPLMERNLTTILKDISILDVRVDGSNVQPFDDPELLKYPVAYLSEPGYWYPSDTEAAGLRHYLDKGGFLIVDDFHFENEWAVFKTAMNRVLPGGVVKRLDLSHPIFNTFFQIKSLEVPYPGRLGEQGLMGEFYGIHRDNDPNSPLTVVVNYNIDIGDYVEWSADQSVYALVPTNEAYKFLINYIIYGLTH